MSDMTREEARGILGIMRKNIAEGMRLGDSMIPEAINGVIKRKTEAIDMAIQALQEPTVEDMELVVTKKTANEITKAFMSGYRYGKEGKDVPKLLQKILIGEEE